MISLEHTKANIVSNLHQQSVNLLVEQLAATAVELEKARERIKELEAPTTAPAQD